MRVRVRISKDNSKGVGLNVSLSPTGACAPGVPCAGDCYAQKSYVRYPMVREAWDANLDAALYHREEYFYQIAAIIGRSRTGYFRWHVAGDILDQDYLMKMKAVAGIFGDVKFLAFTKRHDLDYFGMPENLRVVLSMWPGWGDMCVGGDLPRAWMQDGTETRVPRDAVMCEGKCSDCHACWELAKGSHVIFKKH
jgi:hypothetical protein